MYTIYRTYTLYTIPYIHVDTSLLTDAIVDPLVAKSLNGTLAPTFSWIASIPPLIFAATFYSLLRLDAKDNRKFSQNIFSENQNFQASTTGPIRQILTLGKGFFKGTLGDQLTTFGIHWATCCPSDVLHSQIGEGENLEGEGRK